MESNDNKKCIKVRLLESRAGDYKTLVFLDIDARTYIMCTVLPNWDNHEQMRRGQEGYLNYRTVRAGDSYYNSETGMYEFYKYTANYFEDFVPITHTITPNVVTDCGGLVIS